LSIRRVYKLLRVKLTQHKKWRGRKRPIEGFCCRSERENGGTSSKTEFKEGRGAA